MWIWKKRAEINSNEWDEYLFRSQSDQIELSSWYLDIVAKQWGAFFNEISGARIPIAYHTKWILIKYVYRPPFIQQMNIISQEITDKIQQSELVIAIQQQFPCGQFNTGLNISEATHRKNYILSLSSYQQLGVQLFSLHHKRELSIASTKKLNFKVSTQIKTFISQYQKFSLSKIGHSTIRSVLLDNIISNAIHKQNGFIICCHNELDQPIAGAFFLSYKHRLVYLMSYTNPEGKKKNAMYGLLKNVFDQFNNTHKAFDFEGSDKPGIQFFFEGFGSTLHNYSEWIWRNHFICTLYQYFKKD